MRSILLGTTAGLCVAVAGASFALAAGRRPFAPESGHDTLALAAKVAELEQRTAAPELGHQMLELQIRRPAVVGG